MKVNLYPEQVQNIPSGISITWAATFSRYHLASHTAG